MNPEIIKLTEELNALKEKVALLETSASIPHPVEEAFRERLGIRLLENVPTGLAEAPLSSIANPVGGVTIDANARTAIVSLIETLENLGLIDA